MKRKVIKQANQAYTITLPIDWVRENNISKDSELELTSEGRSLIVSGIGKAARKKVKLELENEKSRNIGRIIKSLYSKGIDEIELKSDKDISKEIYKSLKDTIGFALVSQKGNDYLIKDIGGTNPENLDEIFKRIFQMILSSYEAAIVDVFGEERETLESLEERDREINKFCYFLERGINKMSYKDAVTGRILFTYSFELERIGDEIQRFWRTNIKYKVKKSKELRKLAEDSLYGLGLAFELYYQYKPKIAEEIAELRDKVREDSMGKFADNKYTQRIVRHILKIIEDATDISQLTMMIKIE